MKREMLMSFIDHELFTESWMEALPNTFLCIDVKFKTHMKTIIARFLFYQFIKLPLCYCMLRDMGFFEFKPTTKRFLIFFFFVFSFHSI